MVIFLDFIVGVYIHEILARPGACFSKAPKSDSLSLKLLIMKNGSLNMFQYLRKQNNCEVLWLETLSFWRYKAFYVNRNTPEKFWDPRGVGTETMIILTVEQRWSNPDVVGSVPTLVRFFFYFTFLLLGYLTKL